MIAGVRGRIERIEPGAVVITVGPVDLRVAVPASTAQRLVVGQDIGLRTHFYVREDQLALFGFESNAGLEMFELLLSVSGVGPKVALGVLSALEPADVRRAIARGDTQTLTRAPGVGTRAATRIVAELQTKVGMLTAEPQAGESEPQTAVFTALIGMGYSAAEARRAIDSVPAGASIEDALREALGFLADR
jgi:Holliday junction DNA helicase RuvA